MPRVVFIISGVQALWHFCALCLSTLCGCQNLGPWQTHYLADKPHVRTVGVWSKDVSRDWPCRLTGWSPLSCRKNNAAGIWADKLNVYIGSQSNTSWVIWFYQQGSPVGYCSQDWNWSCCYLNTEKYIDWLPIYVSRCSFISLFSNLWKQT